MALILIVDDSPTIRDMLYNLCKDLGHECAVAKHGEEALIHLDQLNFDMVITDRQMPVMDGEELTAKIRKRGMKIPIVMYTGWSDGIEYDLYHNVISKDDFSGLVHTINAYFCF